MPLQRWWWRRRRRVVDLGCPIARKVSAKNDQRYFLSGSGFFTRPRSDRARFVAAGSRYNAILFRVKFNTSVTTHTKQPALVCAVISFPPPRARLNLCFLWPPPPPVAALSPSSHSRRCRCTASPEPVTSARRYNSVPIVVSTCTIVIRLYAHRSVPPYNVLCFL